MRKIIYSSISFIVLLITGYLSYYYISSQNYVWGSVLFGLALVALVTTIVFVFAFIHRNMQKKISDLQNQVKIYSDISYHVSQAGDEAFNKLPVGIVVYDEAYDIYIFENFSYFEFLYCLCLQALNNNLVNLHY